MKQFRARNGEEITLPQIWELVEERLEDPQFANTQSRYCEFLGISQQQLSDIKRTCESNGKCPNPRTPARVLLDDIGVQMVDIKVRKYIKVDAGAK